MASINGVEVKNVKEIKNNSFEWGSILTGVIYLNGKKLGEWSQDPHGAVCDNFDAGVEKALMPAVLGVKSTKTGIEADIYDASCLIADIVLTEAPMMFCAPLSLLMRYAHLQWNFIDVTI